MSFPTVMQTIARLEQQNVINAGEANQYRSSYEHFKKNRAWIYKYFSQQWVASFNDLLFFKPTLAELQDYIQKEPNARFAYIEEVGSWAAVSKQSMPPELVSNDFLQRYRLSEEEIQKQVKDHTPKEDDQALAFLKEHIEKRIDEVKIGVSITTAVRLLMLQGMDDTEIIAWGRYYFVKSISPSVQIWQMILCSLKTRSTLPNDETELRGIRLCKEICVSLINDFGHEEEHA